MEDITNPDFDPSKLSVTILLRILSRFDVDMPVSKEKKSVYVALVTEHLEYMRARVHKETKAASKKAPKGWAETAKTPTKPIEVLQESRKIPETNGSKPVDDKKAPSSTRKKRSAPIDQVMDTPTKPASIESLVETTPFSEENPFQSPREKPSVTKPLVGIRKQAIEFSASLPVFEAGSTSSLEPASPKLMKSPKKGRRVSFGATLLDTPSKSSKKPSVTVQESIHERLVRRNRAKNATSLISTLTLAVMGLVAVLFAHWMTVDYPNLTYCSTQSDAPVYKPIYLFTPSCVKCPPNAICSSRAVTGCEGGLKLKNSLVKKVVPNWLLPFPWNQPSCAFDSSSILKESKKQRQVEHLIRVTDHIVREFVGMAQCDSGGVSDFVFSKSGGVLGMPVTEAKKELEKLVDTKWTKEKFEEYWSLILDGISKSRVLTMVVDENTHQHRLFASTNPPIFSMTCKAKQAIWTTLLKYSVHLLISGASLILGMVAYLSYQKRTLEARIFASLLPDLLTAIHGETDNYYNDPIRHPIPGLALSQLKDHFLPRSQDANGDFQVDGAGRLVWSVEETSRTRVWERTRKEISKNANVRLTSAHVKGESNEVWMWIGPTALTPIKKRKVEYSELKL